MEPIISARDVWKIYGKGDAATYTLKGVNVDIHSSDYDSSDVLVTPGKTGADFTANVRYLFAGKMVERSAHTHVTAPESSSGALPAVVAMIATAEAVWGWRRK